MTLSIFPLRGRRLVTVVATPALVATALVVGAAQAAPAGVSVVDYAQCANGTSTATTCAGGWINGILQSSNSHFRESDVTPQRLQVKVAKGDHSVSLTYQTRKGGSADGTHAYDGLATWNTTVTGADRCLGLTTADKNGLSCESDTPTSTLAIPADGTEVGPAGAGVSKVTSAHVPATQADGAAHHFEMFGGTLTSVETVNGAKYVHSDAAGGGDDYATIKINFTAASAGNVQLLFGGHLAVSPTSRSGWGTGLGASNINGGPYHIKWTAADGGSVGNRDNQIQGSSIGELFSGRLTTTPSTTSYTTATVPSGGVTDQADVAGFSSPTGSMSFRLYGPFATAPGATSCDSAHLLTSTPLTGTFSATADGYRATSSSFTAPTAVGIYQWIASYAGDANNGSLAGSCGDTSEQISVTQAYATGSSTQSVRDRVTVSGVAGGGTPTGTITFELWSTSDCTTPPLETSKRVFTSTNDLVSGVATSDASPQLATGTYYWKASYTPATGSGYAAGDVEACGVQRVSIDNSYVAPTP